MTVHREIALSLYRWATGRTRSNLARSFARLQSFPASILFYHRVAKYATTNCSISVRDFERQMDWIRQHAVPSSLDAIRQSQWAGTRATNMVGVTFDDGYADNCQFAIPVLIDRNIPATYFVSTYFIESGTPFPHDAKLAQPPKPNSVDQIREIASHGIQIGAHSHSHVDFGRTMSASQLRVEITDVRKRLQDWSGQSVDYFAFPYGFKQHISQEAIDVVFESGFLCFLSAAGGLNWPGQDANHLQRIHGDPGLAAFKNWLTFDPRKIYRENPIQYQMRYEHESAKNDPVPC